MTATIVSAFVPLNTDLATSRPWDALSRAWLALEDVPKVVFAPRALAHGGRNITWVPFEPEELPVAADGTRLPAERNPAKATAEYMQLQLHKTTFLRRAAESVPDGATRHWIWMDFGIFHIFGGDEPRFLAAVRRAAQNAPTCASTVRMPCIWPPAPDVSVEEAVAQGWMDRVLWHCAGGVFGGSGEALARFDDAVQRVREELRACGRLAWEGNVWALAGARCPDLISRFQADHDPRLLESYPNDDKKSE